jgi:uncharacterized protein (TIGR03435 family)
MRVWLPVFFLVGFNVAFGQTAPAFDAVSIKPSPPYMPGMATGVRLDGRMFRSSGIPLRNLIYSAFGVPSWALSGGPGWLDTDAFDITATIPSGTPVSRINEMVQTLLAERFQLKVHKETRDFPVYALVVSKDGSRLQASVDGKFTVNSTGGHLELQHASIPVFIQYLGGAHAADRPVIDRTGLSGYFDFVLNWSPESVQTNSSDIGASIFTAIQEQLGLRLEPRKAPSEFIVIDGVERPSEN